MNVQREIENASEFGQRLEDLVVNKGTVQLGEAGDRDKLLLAYWSLVLDYDKGILTLIRERFYAGAFALLRPTIEAVIRAHVVLMGTDSDVLRIKDDTYAVNFKTVGAEIDKAFGMGTYFDKFLNGARGALHSFTHSGLSQLGRRFKGNDLQAHYGEDEIIEVIRTSSTAVWFVTNLVVKRFKWQLEAEEADRLFLEWGNRSNPG
jgi:hypothetical protein